MRQALSRRGLQPASLEIMIASLSQSSLKQYDVALKKWWNFCSSKSINIYQPTIPQIIDFLTEMFNKGCQYGTLNTYRSALSLILGTTISLDENIHRFFKGVFRLRPTLPKYHLTWDTNDVLSHLGSLYPNEDLSLEVLSKKTCILLALTTAQRVQTLSKINIKNIHSLNGVIIIKIPDFIKTTRPGCKQPVLRLPFFIEKPNVCPAKTLLAYINRTQNIRSTDDLFIAIRKPHKAVGTQTISRWIKHMLADSGVDTSVFTAHSTRHAATSRAAARGVSIDVIRSTAGWSGESMVFAKFYNRVIINNNDMSVAQSILDHTH
jgi:integrase